MLYICIVLESGEVRRGVSRTMRSLADWMTNDFY